MIRYFVSLRVLGAVLLGLFAVLTAVSPARAEPKVSVTPTSSYAYDTFVISGTGFPNGASLSVTFTDPFGATGGIADGYGNNTTVKVGGDGTWELRVQPGSAFRSTATGTYQLSFCQSDAPSTCWPAELKVSNDVPGMAGGGGMGGY